LTRTIETVRMPYRLLLDPAREELAVTSWSDGEVARHDVATGKIAQRVATGALSSGMIRQTRKDGRRLIVAASHTNGVSILDAGRGGELRVAEKLNIAMMPRQPLGMTPSGLALSEDGARLYAWRDVFD
jgi:DNA-binding beta-propeller fold protein YncE